MAKRCLETVKSKQSLVASVSPEDGHTIRSSSADCYDVQPCIFRCWMRHRKRQKWTFSYSATKAKALVNGTIHDYREAQDLCAAHTNQRCWWCCEQQHFHQKLGKSCTELALLTGGAWCSWRFLHPCTEPNPQCLEQTHMPVDILKVEVDQISVQSKQTLKAMSRNNTILKFVKKRVIWSSQGTCVLVLLVYIS